VADDDLPSLEVVGDEVRGALEAQERRAESLDTKAGLLLGIAGLLAGVTFRSGVSVGPAVVAALCLDGVVAVLSLLAFRIRSYPVIKPARLRDYIVDAADDTRLSVLDTRVTMFEETENELSSKARLVEWAVGGLLLAVVATAVAAGLSLDRGGGHDVKQGPPAGQATTSPSPSSCASLGSGTCPARPLLPRSRSTSPRGLTVSQAP